jgi:hypothetical protein
LHRPFNQHRNDRSLVANPHPDIWQFLVRHGDVRILSFRRLSHSPDVERIAQGFSHGIYLVYLQGFEKFVARVATRDWSEKLEKRALNVREHPRLARPECKVPDVLWHNLAGSQDHPITFFEESVEGDPLSVRNFDLRSALRRMFRGHAKKTPGVSQGCRQTCPDHVAKAKSSVVDWDWAFVALLPAII